MSFKRRVGFRIKLVRRRRNLSQEELAERIDRTPEAVSSIERGRTLPNFVTLERLGRALDVPVHEFFDIGPQTDENPRRNRLIAELVEVVRSLSDADLEVALEQARVLSRGRPRDRKRR